MYNQLRQSKLSAKSAESGTTKGKLENTSEPQVCLKKIHNLNHSSIG